MAAWPVRLRATVLEILLAYQGADDEHRVQSAGLAALPDPVVAAGSLRLVGTLLAAEER